MGNIVALDPRAIATEGLVATTPGAILSRERHQESSSQNLVTVRLFSGATNFPRRWIPALDQSIRENPVEGSLEQSMLTLARLSRRYQIGDEIDKSSVASRIRNHRSLTNQI